MPALAHLSIVGAYSTVDPCNNNPGCMAGTPTIYFLVIGSAPTLFILLIVAIIQAGISKPNYSKYLKINFFVAFSPYALLGLVYIGAKVFT